MNLNEIKQRDDYDHEKYMHFIESQDQNTFNMFKDILMLNILLENGNADISGDMYKKNINGIKTEVKITGQPEQLKEIAETFNMPLEIIEEIFR